MIDISINTTQRPTPADRSERLQQMLQLLCDWNVDIDEINARIASVANGVEFAKLFRDVVCRDPKARAAWFASPNARAALTQTIGNCDTAWDHHLAYSPDRVSEARDYICQALAWFKNQTSP